MPLDPGCVGHTTAYDEFRDTQSDEAPTDRDELPRETVGNPAANGRGVSNVDSPMRALPRKVDFVIGTTAGPDRIRAIKPRRSMTAVGKDSPHDG
jgi:hypothetical protein